MIDDFINAHKNHQKHGGSNKKCFLFDEYVLLYGSFKEEELKKVISISNTLKDEGVCILPTLEYKIDTPQNILGYVKGYSLQSRAQGTELYHRHMTENEYKKRLKEISETDYQKLDKFVSDWLSITNAGLRIDPSKCENFFYSDDKISFIDLNLQNIPVSLKDSFNEISQVLTGLGLKTKYKTEGTEFSQIIQNVSRSFIKKGLSIGDFQSVISQYDSFMDQKQISSIVEFLTKEQQISLEQPFYHGSATKIQGDFLHPREQFNHHQDKRVLGAFVTSDIERAKFFALWKCLTGNGQTRQEVDKKTGVKKIFFERLSDNIKPNFYLYTVYEPKDSQFIHDSETEYYSIKPIKIAEQQTLDTVSELNKLGYEVYVLNKPLDGKPNNRTTPDAKIRLDMQHAILNGEYSRVDVANLIEKQQSRNIFQKLFNRQNT